MQNRKALLRTILISVAELRGGLNTATSACSCCGLNKAEAWDEKQMDNELAAIERKVKGWLGKERTHAWHSLRTVQVLEPGMAGACRVSTYDDNAALEDELRNRIARVLGVSPGAVGVIVGTGLVLVKVARADSHMKVKNEHAVVSVLISMGLGGNLYNIM
jgi:hypothetical protein